LVDRNLPGGWVGFDPHPAVLDFDIRGAEWTFKFQFLILIQGVEVIAVFGPNRDLLFRGHAPEAEVKGSHRYEDGQEDRDGVGQAKSHTLKVSESRGRGKMTLVIISVIIDPIPLEIALTTRV
jgi:hypothetical protein